MNVSGGLMVEGSFLTRVTYSLTPRNFCAGLVRLLLHELLLQLTPEPLLDPGDEGLDLVQGHALPRVLPTPPSPLRLPVGSVPSYAPQLPCGSSVPVPWPSIPSWDCKGGPRLRFTSRGRNDSYASYAARLFTARIMGPTRQSGANASNWRNEWRDSRV